ncbi:protein-cysteine N-palmitoyltransferase HHAT-like isoform X2 [Dermacentor andersoni]|uniref:protein-cysteine N-palmitoyltransferase HHAT-like isoform X2 n=1 Tax=Dermacentor andersoni TaxID=34620 RepID=UPI002416B87B|nr:protein-cysteine N-palmitoyltransferase HHAT-like isoform X2 [Dermacentor andersoni]
MMTRGMTERRKQKTDTDGRYSDSESLKWNIVSLLHWVVGVSSFAYAVWSFTIDDKNRLLPQKMRGAFRPSAYGFRRKQDVTNFGWQVELSFVVASWKWLLLHPILARATAYAAPSQLYFRYGAMGYAVTMACFQWNLLRGLSFSLDYVRAHRLAPKQSDAGPPYWRTLAYSFYLPPLYLGPMQNYCDFETQVDKPRTKCTPAEVMAILGTLARSGVHFVLVESFTHYFYSSAMSKLLWTVANLRTTSLLGYGLALNLFFYLRYVFCYGFAGALARAEGIVLPPHSKCITRLTRCSHFWRYFDRGMHLWIKRYVYDPLVGDRRGATWLLLGAAFGFSFSWLWHGMDRLATVWSILSVLGIATEVFAAEARKLRPIRDFEARHLTTPERLRVAGSVLGSPNYLLTIFACIFHLADFDICLILCKRILLGFPFPLVPVLVVLYTACYMQHDIVKWETSARLGRKKEASS